MKLKTADILFIVAIIVLIVLGLLASQRWSGDDEHAPDDSGGHAALIEPAHAAEETAPVAPATREERHQFGTEPDADRLPDTAVDTGDFPRYAIDADAPDDKPLPHYEIADDTYMFFGNIAEVDENNRGFNGNAGFVITEDGVLVIDSLGSPKLGRRMIATIKEVTDKPIRFLVLTHNHPDHSYGAAAFRELGGVTVVAHEGTMDYINSEKIDGSVAYRKDFIPGDMKGFKGVVPDVMVDGDRYSKVVLKLGERTFDVYNVGQHHSYGDLVIRQVEDKIMWIGDLAFNDRVTFMGDGHPKQILEGQDWLMESFADNTQLMVPGHGSAQTAPFPMVEKTHQYVTKLRETMRKAIENGWGLQKAVEQSHFPEWEDVRLYGLNHRTNANYVYTQMELEVF